MENSQSRESFNGLLRACVHCGKCSDPFDVCGGHAALPAPPARNRDAAWERRGQHLAHLCGNPPGLLNDANRLCSKCGAPLSNQEFERLTGQGVEDDEVWQDVIDA